MPASRLHWGFLSTADINKALLGPLRTSKRNQLLAVASRTQSRAVEYARLNKIKRAYGSYSDLLADPDIDVIYNPLPNNLHAEWTIKAVQAGKHVLCEKPLALTIAEVDAISAAAEIHGKVVAEAFMYRSHPQTLKAREIVADGKPQEVLKDEKLLRSCRVLPTSLLQLNLEYLPKTGRFYRAETLAHIQSLS